MVGSVAAVLTDVSEDCARDRVEGPTSMACCSLLFRLWALGGGVFASMAEVVVMLVRELRL